MIMEETLSLSSDSKFQSSNLMSASSPGALAKLAGGDGVMAGIWPMPKLMENP